MNYGKWGRCFLALFSMLAFSSVQTAVAETAPDRIAAVAVGARRPVVALALEGGGALGLAHIGVIKVMEELGIPVDIVIGTSMGAIVGGAYAMGYDAAGMEALVASADWASFFSERTPSGIESYRESLDRSRYFAALDFDSHGFKLGGGLLTGRKVLSFMDRIAIVAPSPVDFDTLPRRYRAVAADVMTGEKVVFDHGSVADAMRASMSIPGVFDPYELDGHWFVDGGVVDNLPIQTARELGAELVIAVDLRGGKPLTKEALERNPLETLTQTLNIFIDANVWRQLGEADLVLPVELAGYQTIDFQDSAAIVAAGEKAARDRIDELRSFAEGLRGAAGTDGAGAGAAAAGGVAAGTAPAGATSAGATETRSVLTVPDRPLIERLVVEGGTAEERALARSLFTPALGKSAEPGTLEAPVARLYESGRFESVRLRRGSGMDAGTLTVLLEDAEPLGHEFRLGLCYEGTYSRAPASRLSISPSVIFRGLTTRDSRLTIDTEFLDALAVKTSFMQPFASRFFAEAFFEYRRDFNPYLSDPANDYRSQAAAARTGILAGVAPYPGMELSFGLGYAWVDESRLPEVVDAVDSDGVPLVDATFSLRRLDSPIFPMSGYRLDLAYRSSPPFLGAEEPFHVFTTAGSGFLSLDTPFSVAVSWRGGTDFSEGALGSYPAPDFYKPNLVDRRLFPAPLEAQEKVGSHVLGIGVETKYRMAVMSGFVGLPVFFLAHGAAGFALQEAANFADALEAVHWNAAVGAGVRFSDAFGISLRGGLHRDTAGAFVPFFALDVGSIGY